MGLHKEYYERRNQKLSELQSNLHRRAGGLCVLRKNESPSADVVPAVQNGSTDEF